MTITGVQAGTGGTAVLSNGNIQFTPTAGGTASFQYLVQDAQGNSAIGTVTINDIPASSSPTVLPGATSGNDTLTGTAGADLIRAGQGQDTVTGGDGDDTFVMVGTTADGQYETSDFNNNSYDLSGVISLADLNGQSTSEAVSGESIDGGTGNDTLHVFGTIDLSGVNLTSIENIIVHSDVTFGEGQLSSMGAGSIVGDGGSAVRISDNGGNSDDLSGITMSNIAQFDLASGVNATMNQANVDAIDTFSNKGTVNNGGDSLSFTTKSAYGDGTVGVGGAGAWKSTAQFDLAQGVSGMQAFIGLSVNSFTDGNGDSHTYPGPGYQSNNSYPASLNYHLESMSITAVDASNLNESTLDLLVGNQGQAEILAGTDRQDFILGSDSGGDTISTGGGTLNFVMSRGGADVITGGSGTDFVSAGAGNDTVNTGDAQDFVTTNDINFSDGSFSLLDNSTAGDDDIDTGGGNDFLAVGGNLQASDQMDGGAGTDYLVFSGNYNSGSALTFGAATATNFEVFIFEGADSQNNALTYDLTTHDATVSTGSTLTVQASGVSTVFDFDGSAETDGSIDVRSGSGNDIIVGGSGADTIVGGDGNDTITGGAGADNLMGGNSSDFVNADGNGNNIYVYTSASHSDYSSSLATADTIRGFDDTDQIDLSGLAITNKDVASILDKGDSLNFASLTTVNFFDNAGDDLSIAVGSDGSSQAVVFVDVDGDGDLSGSDLAIKLNSETTADDVDTVGDFVLT